MTINKALLSLALEMALFHIKNGEKYDVSELYAGEGEGVECDVPENVG